jgi:hypothetical protein
LWQVHALLAPVVLAAAPLVSHADEPPRLIARVDVGLLALANAGAKGGGLSVPTGGTGAGLTDGGGLELGVEVRVSRWIALDLGAGWYRPDLEVARDRGAHTMVDYRSASVDLRTLTFGLVVTPPRLRSERGRLAFGALLQQAEIPEVPAHLGLSVEEGVTGVGFDVRGEWFLSKNRRWGIGGALAFVGGEPTFVDVETGATGSLQVSGMFLRLGVRWAW